MMDDIQAQLENEVGQDFVSQPKTYLGDGVYAFYDGFSVILATVRDGRRLHWMALEPTMIADLKNFFEQAIST